MTEFIRGGGQVGAGGFTVDDWMGIGTEFAAGGSIGKVALLAEVTGYDPRSFGGHDLIAALAGTDCADANAGTGCAGAGNYAWATSVFSQSLGIMAAARRATATAPVKYLLGLQRPDGSFPATLPAAAPSTPAPSTPAPSTSFSPSRTPPAGSGSLPITGYPAAATAGTGAGAHRGRRGAAAVAPPPPRRWAMGRPAMRRATAAAAACVVGVLPLPGTPAAAAPQPMDECTTSSGVVLAVDFGHWGGPLLRSCGTTPTTGYQLLNQGGWRTTDTQHDGPGFICRIGYSGHRSGTLYPRGATASSAR